LGGVSDEEAEADASDEENGDVEPDEQVEAAIIFLPLLADLPLLPMSDDAGMRS